MNIKKKRGSNKKPLGTPVNISSQFDILPLSFEIYSLRIFLWELIVDHLRYIRIELINKASC